MTDTDNAPKIHVDTDWKAQAQAEKEKLVNQANASEASGPGGAKSTGPGGLPPATFESLVSTMATQALFALGEIPDPRSGQRMVHLDLARHHIDMLSVIEEKTKGNLTDDETKMITSTTYELRTRYIQAASGARGV